MQVRLYDVEEFLYYSPDKYFLHFLYTLYIYAKDRPYKLYLLSPAKCIKYTNLCRNL